MSKWVKNDLKNFENHFFQVKKSNFHFISTNHSRMNCNLSSTLKSIIFAFLRPLHWGKPPLQTVRLEMIQKWPQKFQKLIFEVKNQIFIFSQQTISRMYCSWSNILISIMFALPWPLHWGKAAFTDWTRLQMTQTWPQKFRKSVFGVKIQVCCLTEYIIVECVGTCGTDCKVTTWCSCRDKEHKEHKIRYYFQRDSRNFEIYFSGQKFLIPFFYKLL